MRVSDQAYALTLHIQAEVGDERREHVLPYGIAGARVVQADAVLAPLCSEAFEKRAVVLVDHLLRPLRREARAARELIERHLTRDREVVISREAHRRVLPRE